MDDCYLPYRFGHRSFSCLGLYSLGGGKGICHDIKLGFVTVTLVIHKTNFMIIKRLMPAFFLHVLFLIITTGVYAQNINDTKKFLNYFNGIDNMITYKKLKENIEATGGKIQKSSTISEGDKILLMNLYGLVKRKADSLVYKLTSDLLSKPERKNMVRDPNMYVTSLNGIFEAIKTTSTDFNNKYTEVAGPTRGRTASLHVEGFDLPLDKEFGEEIITALLKSLIKSQVKKKISLKPWEDL